MDANRDITRRLCHLAMHQDCRTFRLRLWATKNGVGGINRIPPWIPVEKGVGRGDWRHTYRGYWLHYSRLDR